MNNQILVVGAGISGCVIAERYAAQKNKKVLLIDKRDHIGGNCYDYVNDVGILVPKYGPHFFHTNNENVWEYVSNFTEWFPYEHKVRSMVDGKLVCVPVNITTVNDLFGTKIESEEEMKMWLDENVEKIIDPKNSEESATARVGKKLYIKLFRNYTKKQWGMDPKELDPSIMNRIPVRTNFDDRYFTDKYQAMPKDGYTKLFERMLNNNLITIKLNTSFDDIKNEVENFEKTFFTGRIDQYFNYRYGGKLQYRSLKFKHENLSVDEYYQPYTQVNYPNTKRFTRITEPKHANHLKFKGSNKITTIIKEFPTWKGEPFYPVISPKNQETYKKYQAEAGKLESKNVYFVGRLANYKYFNMDEAFSNALQLFNKIENC